MKRFLLLIMLVTFCIASAGCGETISGVSKDASRIGGGVKKVFFREGSD
ncbi:MAG: hypothetical protein HQ575_00610 [Candidatus Omnitrophica bacterium]|nr:hypothetical protein [Candidatus Omnitrophota bacterium]